VKIIITQISPVSDYFLLGTDILLRTLFLNTLNVCSSLSVRDEVSNSRNTTGKIIVLCNLLCFYTEEVKTIFRIINGRTSFCVNVVIGETLTLS
jgi:hypothetical protein